MFIRRLLFALVFCAAAPAAAQLGQSEGYRFLQAIRDSDGNEVNSLLAKPGTTVVNAKDYSSGETALHIVAKRGDTVYTRFLLQKGANPNIRDARGTTPLAAAVIAGQDAVIPLLIQGKADVNLANPAGESPLILAVHLRQYGIIRALLDSGADPDAPDNLAGKSARDYAVAETRQPQLAALFANVPKRDRRRLVGPR